MVSGPEKAVTVISPVEMSQKAAAAPAESR